MKRDSLIWGIILVLLGLGFLLFQLFPGLWESFSWPWILIVIGGIFAVASLISRIGGLMIPGAVIAGLGGIFMYQQTTGDWASWAYIWTLFPGLVGLAMLIGSLYDPELRPARPAAFIMLVASAAGFAIFGGFFGLDTGILSYWPVLLIIAGAWILLRALIRPSQKVD